ncbi:hypothetical protein [Ponticoccus alexandrii]|uniref:Biofilm-associated protein BapA-like prefix-like domain-containing protein n=1 Tax=Ponticoccus alexandrii TaxID=1943633 RepID=A0ABX7F9L1_9RHOB|nr:hypothetical protein [Ponticoccus alexandrii]ETA50039.1 hypothetical protein P279_21605 [Rhodobacteraceae bacterium PD-2]QRF66057.1 hypothetical protein GQA70_06845 [Ponticoccus alexandrii]
MATELTVRGVGQEQSQSLVVEAGIALNRASDVALPGAGSEVVGHEKMGRDLAVQMSDGRTLKIGNFFVIDPEGDYSRLLDARGEPMVTGLTAPEPSMDDMGPTLDTGSAPGAAEGDVGPSRSAAASGETGEADGDAAAFGGGSTMLSAGAGLAAGYGSMSLFSDVQDDDGDDDQTAQMVLSTADQPAADADALQQDIDALLGAPEGEDEVALALDAILAMAMEDGAVDDGDQSSRTSLETPQADGSSAPFFAEATELPPEGLDAPDLLLPLTAEGET